MHEESNYILQGPPPLKPLPEVSLGKIIYDKLLENGNDDPLMVDALTESCISSKELLVKSCLLAESLKRIGYGRNSIISICSENSNEYFIPVIAALYIGAIVAPINNNYSKLEMVHALNISKPTIIFCSSEVVGKILNLKRELTFIERIIVINGDDGDFDSMNKFINCGKQFNSSEFAVTNVHPHDNTGFILCSSGTTGLPKGVMLTHGNVITTFLHTDDPRFFNQKLGRCALGMLPFYHSYGMFRTLNCIQKNMQIIVLKKFEEQLFLSTIEKYKISSLPLVPPLAVLLARSPSVEKYDLSSIVEVTCGAAPLSRNIEELLKQRLKINSVQQAYGLTETTIRAIGMPFGEQKFGSSGKLCPYMLCKIRDPETGKSLGPNSVGELCFKGPTVMKGYYGDEEATRNAFTNDGWLRTGDLGYCDDEEYFYVVDRLKELIKYKGFQVPPAELEALLLTNPNIKDAGVVGLPDEAAGELPLAFVVRNPNTNITEKQVKDFISEKVSSPKRLRGGVIFISEIPKTASGKILRRRLKELLIKHKSKL